MLRILWLLMRNRADCVFIVDDGLNLMLLIIMLSIMMILILKKLQIRARCMSLIVDGGLEGKGLHVVGLFLLFLPGVFQSKS